VGDAGKRETTHAQAEKRPNIRLEEHDQLTLSPDSATWAHAFKRVQTRSIEEVREVLGPAKVTGSGAQACCADPELAARVVTPDEVVSEDPIARASARALVVRAARAYVRSADPTRVAQWVPAIDRYLEVYKVAPQLTLVLLNDIEVANGATLTLSPKVHAVYANAVRIHGTGTIRCLGSVTFKINSLEGVTGTKVSSVASIAAAP